jgi:hypothetical protein
MKTVPPTVAALLLAATASMQPAAAQSAEGLFSRSHFLSCGDLAALSARSNGGQLFVANLGPTACASGDSTSIIGISRARAEAAFDKSIERFRASVSATNPDAHKLEFELRAVRDEFMSR